MGNMGNPLINRWGMNTFWYHFWYSDNYYSKFLQQDQLYITLLNMYLYFGLYSTKNFFWNGYWYTNQRPALTSQRYFRWFNVRNALLGTQSSYKLRLKTPDIYPMKLWILRHDNWVVVNLYWFQPTKANKARRLARRTRLYDSYSTPTITSYHAVRRLKTLLTVNLVKRALTTPTYAF